MLRSQDLSDVVPDLSALNRKAPNYICEAKCPGSELRIK